MLFHNCPGLRFAGPSRRQFLAGLAPRLRRRAARARAARAARQDADRHAPSLLSAVLPAAAEGVGGQAQHPALPGRVRLDAGQGARAMDKNGIRTAVMSLASTPGLWFDAGADKPPRPSASARTSPPRCAATIRAVSRVFAPLSMMNVDVTLKEIEYAFDTLKADGINLQSNYGDKWLGDAMYQPVLAELNRRKAVVYVHPLVAACCGRLSVGAFPAVIEVPHDTTRTVTSLLLTGSFARFPTSSGYSRTPAAPSRCWPGASRRSTARTRRPRSSRRTASSAELASCTTTPRTRPRRRRWRRCSSSCRSRRSPTAPTIRISRSIRTRTCRSSVSPAADRAGDREAATRCGCMPQARRHRGGRDHAVNRRLPRSPAPAASSRSPRPASAAGSFIGGAAAAGLAATGFAPKAFAQAKPHRIDVHPHVVPPTWLPRWT